MISCACHLQGRKVSFKNTIIILTSNLGSSYILDMGQKDPDSVKDMVMSIVSASCLACCRMPLRTLICSYAVDIMLQNRRVALRLNICFFASTPR